METTIKTLKDATVNIQFEHYVVSKYYSNIVGGPELETGVLKIKNNTVRVGTYKGCDANLELDNDNLAKLQMFIKKTEQASKEKELSRYGSEFKNAKPNDYINSGFGYKCKKKDFFKAQKMGFDGIENL